MGRPLNKRNFGPPTDGGNEIKVQFHNGTSSVDGWIVRQTGSKRFVCSDGSNEAECYIVDVAAGSLAEGEMSITVLDDSAVARRITKVAAHKVTASDGLMYGWDYSSSTTDGRVEMEEAGGDTAPIAITGASGDGSIATIVTAAHPFTVGQEITVAGMNPVGYDGTHIITAVTETDISYESTEVGAFVSGGTVEIAEDDFGI